MDARRDFLAEMEKPNLYFGPGEWEKFNQDLADYYEQLLAKLPKEKRPFLCEYDEEEQASIQDGPLSTGPQAPEE